MCRVLAYLGPPVLLDDLLYRPDSSLVKQSVDPKMLHMLNLGGFGMMAWDPSSHDPSVPYTYKSIDVPVFDPNLKGLALKIRAHSLLAHVRGVAYHSRVSLGEHNLLSPFCVLGGDPEGASPGGSPTRVEVGDHNVIREGVTISRGGPKLDPVSPGRTPSRANDSAERIRTYVPPSRSSAAAPRWTTAHRNGGPRRRRPAMPRLRLRRSSSPRWRRSSHTRTVR